MKISVIRCLTTHRFKIAASCLLFGTVAAIPAFANDEAPQCNMGAITEHRTIPAASGPVSQVPDDSVSMIDAGITRKVFVHDPIAKRSPTGTMEVLAQISNCTEFPLQIEARTQFFDAGRIPSEPVSAWQRVFLSPHSDGTYREFSVGTDVQTYLVEVREGK